MSTHGPDADVAPARRLKPVLGLRALTLFGVAFVGPTAPYAFFGIGTSKSHGHLAAVYVIATLAMMFTAVSYGRLANAHPNAGSAYSYASFELHPLAGYFAGWVMILDYVLLPVISVIIISITLSRVVPSVPYAAWVLGSASAITAVNLRGIRVTAGFTLVYTGLLAISTVCFVALAVQALRAGTGEGTLFSFKPFYQASHFSSAAFRAALAITVLSFLGFDGVSTLAEDSQNPRRDVPRATVLTCLVCGISFVVLAYLGQLLWPDWTTFRSLETAFSDVGAVVGGPAMFATISACVLGQAVASAITSQASASRLLYAMAREDRLPRTMFSYLQPRLNTPVYSLGLIGLLSAAVPLALSLDQAAQMVNFGACLGFILVNLSALVRARREWRRFHGGVGRLLAPFIGGLICVWVWLSLSRLAMWVGLLWTGLGLLWLAVITRGRFRWPANPAA